jgi:hypothetical protein
VGKTPLKRLAKFVELGWDDDPNAPSLHDVRGKRGPEHKQEVVAYLRAGIAFIISPGMEEDIFDPTRFAGSGTIATDGVYAWPRTLAHYVEKYDVELPADFEAHMQRNGWKVPDNIDKSALDLAG